MRKVVALEGVFLSLLAACGGPRAPEGVVEPTRGDAGDAVSTSEVPVTDSGALEASSDALDAAPEADPAAVPKVTVLRAPTVPDVDSTEPVGESGGRASWIDGRGQTSNVPAIDPAVAARSRASSFVPVTNLLPPTGIDYLRRAQGCRGPVPMVLTGAGAPSAPEVDAAIAQASDSPVLWRRGGVWYRGSIADAMLPLRSPADAVVYLRLKCIQIGPVALGGKPSFGVFTAGKNVEVFVTVEEDFRACPHSNMTRTTVLVSISPEGKITATGKEHHTFTASSAPCIGRDTAGNPRLPSAIAPHDPRAYFAMLARDEAVSTDSFVRLAAELEGAGAPAELVARALDAAADEARHADAMVSMCSTYGARPDLPPRTAHETRDRVAMLVENAREGCVNETFAALVAARQAAWARDPATRALFARIAADEQRHAELAWDIDAWGHSQVSGDERDAIERARMEAYDALEVFLAERSDAPWFALVGEPERSVALALARGLRAELAS